MGTSNSKMESIRKKVEQYNRKADAATIAIKAVNDQLVEMKTGIPIRLGHTEKGKKYKDEKSRASYEIGFGKVDGKWGIYARKNRIGEGDKIYMNQPRSARLIIQKALPDLIAAIDKALDEEIGA